MKFQVKWHFFFPLQGAMDVALGSAASGVFTNSDWLWEQLHKVLNLLSKHNLIIFVSQLPGWLTGCVCVYICICVHTHASAQAGVVTGDRVWRMPLFQHYTRQVTDSQLADLNNIGKYSRYVSLSQWETAVSASDMNVTQDLWATVIMWKKN